MGLMKFYGKWCGPNWTGGFKKPWDKLTPEEQRIADAVTDESVLDTACRHHDKCHAGCRAKHPCDMQAQSACLVLCDRVLYREGSQDPEKTWWKNKITNYMADSNPKGEIQDSCKKPENPMFMIRDGGYM
jgi:hypothetical protein